MSLKWDLRFLELAEHVAQWSKDPSTKVGSVIVRPDRTVASVGYNGFPRGINDTAERLNDKESKYAVMVHAEINAILNAKEPINSYILYSWPFFPCSRCAVQIIQSGIKRVVSIELTEALKEKRSKYSQYGLSRSLLKEANISFELIKEPENNVFNISDGKPSQS